MPESGSSFPASQEIEFLIQSADQFGVTNIQFFAITPKSLKASKSYALYGHQPGPLELIFSCQGSLRERVGKHVSQ